jgi:hypothetical protein
LERDPIVRVLVGQVRDIARVRDRQQPVRCIVAVFGHAAGGIGHLPQAAAAVVLVPDRAPDVVLGLRDPIARVVRELDEPAVRRNDARDVAGLTVGVLDLDGVAEAIADRLERRVLAE